MSVVDVVELLGCDEVAQAVQAVVVVPVDVVQGEGFDVGQCAAARSGTVIRWWWLRF